MSLFQKESGRWYVPVGFHCCLAWTLDLGQVARWRAPLESWLWWVNVAEGIQASDEGSEGSYTCFLLRVRADFLRKTPTLLSWLCWDSWGHGPLTTSSWKHLHKRSVARCSNSPLHHTTTCRRSRQFLTLSYTNIPHIATLLPRGRTQNGSATFASSAKPFSSSPKIGPAMEKLVLVNSSIVLWFHFDSIPQHSLQTQSSEWLDVGAALPRHPPSPGHLSFLVRPWLSDSSRFSTLSET